MQIKLGAITNDDWFTRYHIIHSGGMYSHIHGKLVEIIKQYPTVSVVYENGFACAYKRLEDADSIVALLNESATIPEGFDIITPEEGY